VLVVTKTLPALCLAAWLSPPRTRDAAWIAAGLGLSAVGDALLELGWFLPGLGAFLVAHLAYIGAYLGRTRAPQLGRLLPVLAVVVPVYAWLAPHLGAMRGPVVVYIAVISAMVWRAAAQVGEDREDPLRPWLATVGAVMFAVSDAMVAWCRFVDPAAALKVPLMLLYWGGQAAIAASARR
jgi:uncharacterized membrane protein YhhN